MVLSESMETVPLGVRSRVELHEKAAGALQDVRSGCSRGGT
jgi:hypothetical protein